MLDGRFGFEYDGDMVSRKSFAKAIVTKRSRPRFHIWIGDELA